MLKDLLPATELAVQGGDDADGPLIGHTVDYSNPFANSAIAMDKLGDASHRYAAGGDHARHNHAASHRLRLWRRTRSPQPRRGPPRRHHLRRSTSP